LQSAPNITGTFTNLPGATSPYTNPITGAHKFLPADFKLMITASRNHSRKTSRRSRLPWQEISITREMTIIVAMIDEELGTGHRSA